MARDEKEKNNIIKMVKKGERFLSADMFYMRLLDTRFYVNIHTYHID